MSRKSKTEQSVSQDSLLHAAVLEDNEKATRFLLKHGADANARLRNEPLQRLGLDGNPEIREIFHRYRSPSLGSIGSRGLLGRSSSNAGTCRGHFQQLHRSASNVSEKRHSRTPTPVHVAAANGNAPIVELLLEHGGDPNAEMEGEYCALSIAILRRHLPVVELLLARGANVDFRGRSGKTPLYFAVKSKQIEAVRLLLANGADVNRCTEHGVSPLHVAVERKLQDVTELLLKSGSRVNAATKTGVTPLHCAAVKGQKEITEMILGYGGDVSLIMKKGEIDVTPLLWVTENERRKTADILDKYVAKANTGGYYSRFFKKAWKQLTGKKATAS